MDAGMLAFYAALGLAVAWAGSAVDRVMAYLIPTLGAAFLVAGALILTGRAGIMDRLARLNPALGAYERAASTPSPLFSLGLLYGAGGHGCSLPIFLGIRLVPLASGAPSRAAVTVLAYGVALALCLLLTVAIGREAMPLRGRLWGETPPRRPPAGSLRSSASARSCISCSTCARCSRRPGRRIASPEAKYHPVPASIRSTLNREGSPHERLCRHRQVRAARRGPREGHGHGHLRG
jgi:hypothetical protein